ncbi:LuxR C-terminal-related transcriptional regulator [Actinoplanes sp. KI2]|uniref:helix-turn-helix transcriptional regulator n=1 Tax=Actinoplanes sp. KI2 TaxID=2983315 RepID=UPI0021D5F5F2|nr:LuxR family transcriptional regulator [Actinoplanes sp. KI2]MCU7729292.1 LuxR C-terminal-related transcriptional regulator [Actinoplanes sp. KI2]
MAMPMVGRATAVAELRRSWSRAQAGRAPITAVVTGTAGTGKSALVAALLREAGAATVLAGTARVHSPAPYDWLAAVLAGRDTRGLDVPPDALAWLKQDPDVPRERYTPEALLRIAVATVRALVGGAPAVLVVEDLHALDPASLNLVAELATTDLPALLLVTSQPAAAAVSPQLTERTLARLGGRPGAVRRHLSGLLPAEVGEILEHVYGPGACSPEVAEAVWRRTDGNPYRLSELLAVEGAAVLERPHADLSSARSGVVGRLTAREREVLGLLAEGMANKQIATALGISVRTVTVHVSNLLRKTGASSRTEAALWALSGRRSGDHQAGWRDNRRAARSQSSA